MVNYMNKERTFKIPHSVIANLMISTLAIYIFAYQFAYPFSSTFFLYIAFGCAVLWMIFCGKIYLSTQMLIMTFVVVVSAIGALYTSVPVKGNREAILTFVVWLLLIAFAQNSVLLEKIKGIIKICSFVVFLGILFQYLFTDLTNSILGGLLRSDCYEQLMYSYTVDGAYAGFSAYTADAAYFCAVLFGFAIFGWLQQGDKLTLKNKVIRSIVIIFSIFSVMITSKRGVFVALLISFIITYMVWRKFSIKAIISTIVLMVTGVILLNILIKSNEILVLFLNRFDPAEGDITTGRSEMWHYALKCLSNEFVGMGTGASYELYSNGLHNIYLQLFYDHGIIGLSVYLLFFVTNLIQAVRRKEPIAIYIQLLMLVYGMSGNPIYSNSFFIVYSIFSVVSVDVRNGDSSYYY